MASAVEAQILNHWTTRVVPGCHTFKSQRSVVFLLIELDAEGSFMMVQWLRLLTRNVGGLGSIPGQRTRIPHATTKDPAYSN